MKRIILVLLIIGGLLAIRPSGGGKTLIFSSFTSGGVEGGTRYGSTYEMTDNLGSGGAFGESKASGDSHDIYGGFRFIDLDLRAPFAGSDVPDSISAGATFYVEWSGVDTTTEDGPGWGMWVYDVQWSKESDPGNWHDWHTQTYLTNDLFGPFEPDTVKMDTTYYFRVRGYDLAQNVGDWGEQSGVTYQPPSVTYTVTGADGDSIWVTDTLEVDDWTTISTSDYFTIENNGPNQIDMGIYAFNTTNWQLADEPGRNRYSLHAIFNDATVAPDDTLWSDSTVVKSGPDNIAYATPNRFGTGGWKIWPYWASGTFRRENLWLHLRAPTFVTRYGGYENEMVLIKLEARTTIY